ncbi:acyltransferase family protein [Silvibacterium sp.]|uniref:acyltransferase family protein n=1 Tax=Silvibacterium sp. TaxID=1964179 RepID=UPI0039E275FE
MKAEKAQHGYRPDIDGLRAIAVLLVVACHLKMGQFTGGYVGVDVFFVISGFLISAIILSKIERSRFSLVEFYERRIRRIIPALLGVLIFSSIMAWRFLLPTEMRDYGLSLLAAVFSFSNIYFWTQSGYFDAPAATKPLLHTWSLGVEEQFYFVFPLFLMLVRKLFPQRLRAAVVGLAAVSLAVSAYGAYHDRETAFYMLHCRAWEMLLGTILSMRILPQLTNRLAREIVSGAGLLAILFAGHFYSAATPFPGFAALAPCLGAAAIIAAGQAGISAVGRLLSTRPFTFIGLISYSLYLWHWPIIVFQSVGHVMVGNGSIRSVQGMALVLSLVAGYLSWLLIETPFRNGRFKLSGAPLFAAAGVIALVVAVSAASALHTHGYPSRFSPEATRVGSYLDYKADYRQGTCFLTSSDAADSFNEAACLTPVAGEKNYLLMGDSHAAQLWHGLNQELPGVHILQATASGCRPMLDGKGEPRCTHLVNWVLRDYLAAHHVDGVYLAARWEPGEPAKLAPTIAWLEQQHIPVTVFGPLAEYDTAFPRLLVAELSTHDPSSVTSHELTMYRKMDAEMKALNASQWHARYLSYFDTLCPQGPCPLYAGNQVPFQYDLSHLTSEGSSYAVRQFVARGLLP